MIASLQRQIERLLGERRLHLANKLIDKLNLGLRGRSITSEVALSLEEGRAQVAKLFSSAGTGDTFSDAQIQLAQEAEPLSLPPGFIGTVLRTLNRGSGSAGIILDVFTSDAATRKSGKDVLTALCNKMLAEQMHLPLWLLYFSPGPHPPDFGQPVRAYHFTAPRPARNLLSPRGTRGCLHGGSPGRPHGGASSARS